MYYLKLIFICVITFLFFCTVAHAETATGHIGARILDPLLMDVSTAVDWCKEKQESVKCDILIENLEELKITGNWQEIDIERNSQDTEYEILTIDFQ